MKRGVSRDQTNCQRFTLAGDRNFPVFAGSFHTGISQNILLAVNKVHTMISKLIPSAELAKEQILALLQSAWKVSDAAFSEQDAVIWADDYHFPGNISDRDIFALKSVGYDLSSWILHYRCE